MPPSITHCPWSTTEHISGLRTPSVYPINRSFLEARSTNPKRMLALWGDKPETHLENQDRE